MTVKLDTSKSLASMDALVKKKNAAVNRALIVSAQEVSAYIKKSITSHKSKGREYLRGTVSHFASRPGYPPNGDTGFLAFSTSPTKTVKNGAVYVRVVAKYAKALEYGKLSKGLKPRPFVKPARQKLGAKIAKRIRDAFNVK